MKKGIKNSCSKSYFYANNGLFEACLSPLENIFNDVFIKLYKEMDLTKLSKEDYAYILYFICIQYTRTDKLKIESEEFFDAAYKGYLKEIYSSMPNFTKEKSGIKELIDLLEKCKITATGAYDQSFPHMQSMLLGLTSPFLIYDLVPLLLLNHTNQDYIISDHPIVLYNKFFNAKREMGLTGFASHGLQIFFPIGPKVLLLLYDKNFYNFNTDTNTQIVNLEEDVTAMNSLQFFNCHELILFSDERQSEYINNLHRKLETSLNKNPEKFKWIICPSSFGLPTLYMKMNRNNIEYDLELSFMSLKKVSEANGYCRNLQGIDEQRSILNSLEKKYHEYASKDSGLRYQSFDGIKANRKSTICRAPSVQREL
jgi:hypothetical protein